MKTSRYLVSFVLATMLALPAATPYAAGSQLFTAAISSGGISFTPEAQYPGVRLTVLGPDGAVSSAVFEGDSPVINRSLLPGSQPDGYYTYELRVLPAPRNAKRGADDISAGGTATGSEPQVQNGHFLVSSGEIVTPSQVSEPAPSGQAGSAGGSIVPLDAVTADDAIITGSMCIGFDCLTDGTESFGFDTLKLKENNLQIFFDDTSSTAGFPANDWRIIVNDSASGGGNYFTVEDSTNAKKPFKIEAGARTSALYVSSSGRVGFGTSTPVLNQHILAGDTPAIRFDQDTSAGWTAQVWDIAGNESNFFVRDTTGGSRLPFRIQPGAPTNSISVCANGAIVIGGWCN